MTEHTRRPPTGNAPVCPTCGQPDYVRASGAAPDYAYLLGMYLGDGDVGPFPRKKPTIFKEPNPVVEKKPLAKQEVMQFEPVTRGRFEKSEPTIVEGQDLDVPTFLRKNVRVK